MDQHSAQRLVRLLGMLGSQFDGEVVTAGRMANEFIKDLGLTWDDVIAGCNINNISSANSESDWQRMARYCMSKSEHLELHEIDFVRNVSTYRTAPTDRQMQWLCDLYAKVLKH